MEGGCRALLQGDLPNPGIVPVSPALQSDSLSPEPPEKPQCGCCLKLTMDLAELHVRGPSTQRSQSEDREIKWVSFLRSRLAHCGPQADSHVAHLP